MVTVSHDAPESAPAAPGDSQPARRTHSRRRRAFGLVLAGVMVMTAVAGAVAWRIVSTFDALHSQSTPPPIVSGFVLGGSPDVQIDSGPALTSVASAGELTPTAGAVLAETTLSA